MEIILKQDVASLGRKGDVVKVADGYGRNYLLPQRLAIPATPGNLKNIEQMKGAAARKDAQDHTAAQAQADQIGRLRLVFERRAGAQGTLFGSVTSMDLAEQLAQHGFEIDRRKLDLPEPLKAVGEFQVPVHLYRGVTAQVGVEIRAQAAPEAAPAPEAPANETTAD